MTFVGVSSAVASADWRQGLATGGPALIALAGVLSGFWWQRKLADRERVLTTKRDHYLALADSVARALHYLAKLSDFEGALPKDPYKKLNRLIAQAQVVASIKTSVALTALNAQLAKTLMTLHKVRMPGIFLSSVRQTHQRQLDLLNTKLEAVVVTHMRYMRGKTPDQLAVDLRHGNFWKERTDLLTLVSVEATAVNRVVTEMGQISNEVMDAWAIEMRHFMSLQTDLLASIRQELIIKFDRPAFVRMQENTYVQSMGEIAKFRHAMKEALAAAMAKPN